MSGWLNIACSGKFHYLYYAKYLVPDVLKNIYFSHKLSTIGGVADGYRKNLFLKEYLTGLHLKILGEHGVINGMGFYNRFWEFQLGKIFSIAPVNLFLLHGNCLDVMLKAKHKGIVVGEAVNAHPDIVWSRLREEAMRIGLPLRVPAKSVARIKQEVAEVDYLLCPSTAVADSFVESGFNRARTIVIPYGVERDNMQGLDYSVPMGRQHDGSDTIKSVLCVGQITLRKGQLRLLDLIGEHFDNIGLPYPHVTFIGRADPAYLKLMVGHRVPFSVEGHVAHHELMAKFCQFDVFCLASLEDGFAMVVLEAALAGIPTVVSCYAGASELVRNVDGCAVFNPFVQTEFSMALNRVAGRHVSLDLQENSWEFYAKKLSASLNVLRREGL